MTPRAHSRGPSDAPGARSASLGGVLCALVGAILVGLRSGDAAAGQHVYASDRDGNWEIYLVTRAGEVRLTRDPGQDRRPALSADGRHVAFSSDRSGDLEIYAVHADGTGLIRLTRSLGEDDGPAWCSGDSAIVFVSARAGRRELWVMSPDGTRQRLLSRQDVYEYEPAWSAAELGRNAAPRAWLAAWSQSPTRVRFDLTGTFDREEGRHLRGTLTFGDRSDTSFAAVPRYVEHQYPAEGRYQAALQVRDGAGLSATVYLDLTLRTEFRSRPPELEFERQYQSPPLDR